MRHKSVFTKISTNTMLLGSNTSERFELAWESVHNALARRNTYAIYGRLFTVFKPMSVICDGAADCESLADSLVAGHVCD